MKRQTAKSKGSRSPSDDDSDFQMDDVIKNREKSYHKWSFVENILYAKFLKSNEGSSKQVPKGNIDFSQMAEKLQIGKNAQQCRNHHQKMLKRFGNIEAIIAAYAHISGEKCEEMPMETSTTIEPMGDPKFIPGLAPSQFSAWKKFTPQ